MDKAYDFLAPNAPPVTPDLLFDNKSFKANQSAEALRKGDSELKTDNRPGFTNQKQDGDCLNVRRTAPDTVCCAECKTQIAFATQILSKGRRAESYHMIAPPALHADQLYCPSFSNVVSLARARLSDEYGEHGPVDCAELDEVDKPLMLTHPHLDRKDLAMRWRSNNLSNIDLSTLVIEEDPGGGIDFSIVCNIFCSTCHSCLGHKVVDATSLQQEQTIGRFMVTSYMVVIRKHYSLVSDTGVESMDASLQRSLPSPKPVSSVLGLDSGSTKMPDDHYFAMRSQNAVALAEANPMAAAMAHNNARLRRAKALQHPDDPDLMDFNTSGMEDDLRDRYEAGLNCCVDTGERIFDCRFFTEFADAIMHRGCQVDVQTYRTVRRGSNGNPPIDVPGSKNGFRARERRNLVVAPHLEFDDSDEDEAVMLFEGQWDPIVVASMRPIKCTAAVFTKKMQDRTERWLYETRLVGVIKFVEWAASLCLAAISVAAVLLACCGFVPWPATCLWLVLASVAFGFLKTRQYDLLIVNLAAKGYIGLSQTAPGRLLRIQKWVHSRKMDARIQVRAIPLKIWRWIRSFSPVVESLLFWLCFYAFVIGITALLGIALGSTVGPMPADGMLMLKMQLVDI